MASIFSSNTSLSGTLTTISNNGLTITGPGNGTYADQTMRANDAMGSTELMYTEVRFDLDANTTSLCAGLSNTSHTITLEIGSTTSSISVFRGDGSIWYNNAQVATLGANVTIGGTNRLCMAVNVPAQRMWLRINSGSWNANTSDPAANTGGISIPFTGPYYFSMNCPREVSAGPDTATWMPYAGLWQYTPPSGFDEYLPSGTTWDASYKGSDIVLSGQNRIAYRNGTTNSYDTTRTIATILASQKVYFEVYTKGNGSSGVNDSGVGVMDSSYSLGANGTGIWASPNSFSYWGDGSIYINGSAVTNIGSWPASPVLICCAFDAVNKLAWFRQGTTGNWNNSGTANPATGTGGVNVSTGLSGSAPYYAAVSHQTNLMYGVGGFGTTTYFGTAPAGFTYVGAPALRRRIITI